MRTKNKTNMSDSRPFRQVRKFTLESHSLVCSITNAKVVHECIIILRSRKNSSVKEKQPVVGLRVKEYLCYGQSNPPINGQSNPNHSVLAFLAAASSASSSSLSSMSSSDSPHSIPSEPMSFSSS